MTPEEIYTVHLKEATNLFNQTINDLNSIFEKNKKQYNKGKLYDTLVNNTLRNKFTEKFPPSNAFLTDSKGNIIHNSLELDRHLFKMYLELVNLPEKLVNQLE